MYVQHYYDEYNERRSIIPQYLEDAYNSIQRTLLNKSYSTFSITNLEYLISENGRFRVFYDPNSDYGNIEWLAQLTADAYDAIDWYLCTSYSFPRPRVNSSGYYDITISATMTSSGLTSYVGGYSNIKLLQAYLVDFGEDYRKSEVLGVMIHEYMHAILFEAGIMTNAEAICFHESMARAAGIEYETAYANWSGICGDISFFIDNLCNTMGNLNNYEGEDRDRYKYGGAIFYVFMFEVYDEWNLLSEMVNNYSSNNSIFNNLNQTLLLHNRGTLTYAYERFLAFAVAPDELFELSPTNRINSNSGIVINSWGTPSPICEITIPNSSNTFSSDEAIVVPYMASNYIKIIATNSTPVNVTININYVIPPSSSADAAGSCVAHNATSDTYSISTGVIYDNELSYTYRMSSGGNDIVYIAIANGGLSGNLEYTYTITLS